MGKRAPQKAPQLLTPEEVVELKTKQQAKQQRNIHRIETLKFWIKVFLLLCKRVLTMNFAVK